MSETYFIGEVIMIILYCLFLPLKAQQK